jgi:hypothetical protein
VKHRRHVQLDPGQLEQLTPEIASEDWIAIADNGGLNPVEAHNVVEEATNDGCCSVGMAERQKVCGLSTAECSHHQEQVSSSSHRYLI